MKSFDISLQFEKNPSNKCFQAIWKSSSSRSRKSESEVKNYPLLKKSCTLENELKNALLLLCFLTTWLKQLIKNYYQMRDTKFLQFEALIFSKFS